MGAGVDRVGIGWPSLKCLQSVFRNPEEAKRSTLSVKWRESQGDIEKKYALGVLAPMSEGCPD